MQDHHLNDRRIFAVGDVHGCHRKLAALMDRLPADPARDTLVFLGDYLNRGPGSREVLDLLLDLEQRFAHAVFLMGNHEHMLLEYARTADPEQLRLLRALGSERTLASYDDSPPQSLSDLSFLPSAHLDFLHRLKAFHRQGDYVFVHAGLAPGLEPEDTPLERLLNIRGEFLEHERPGGKVTVFGHTPFDTPLVAGDKIGIDTGAVYGNMLTAVELPALRFHHA